MTSVGLHWEELLMPLLQKYKLNITWGDQDLLNIIFHHNPGKAVHLYACILNSICIVVSSQDIKRPIFFVVPRVPAGVSLPVELSSRSLYLWQ